MKILAIDDSELALKLLVSAISEALPMAEIAAFDKPSELLTYAEENVCDIAFLDIKMWGMDGLAVAKCLKEINPKMNIIFVTAYLDYASSAFSLHASGYILKPVTKEAVQREIENLRHPIDKKKSTKIYVQTFGNFEVFVDGTPLTFSRSKAKETLAYLIDRRGTSVKTSEIAGILWEDREYDRSLQNQTQKIIASMMQTLRENDAADIVIKKWNQISVDKGKITCDYYDLLEWDAEAMNAYFGEYMNNYSWAEMTTGDLSRRILKE